LNRIETITLTFSGVRAVVLLQDIIKDDEIKLDWFFKASLIHDIVKVSTAAC